MAQPGTGFFLPLYGAASRPKQATSSAQTHTSGTVLTGNTRSRRNATMSGSWLNQGDTSSSSAVRSGYAPLELPLAASSFQAVTNVYGAFNHVALVGPFAQELQPLSVPPFTSSCSYSDSNIPLASPSASSLASSCSSLLAPQFSVPQAGGQACPSPSYGRPFIQVDDMSRAEELLLLEQQEAIVDAAIEKLLNIKQHLAVCNPAPTLPAAPGAGVMPFGTFQPQQQAFLDAGGPSLLVSAATAAMMNRNIFGNGGITTGDTSIAVSRGVEQPQLLLLPDQQLALMPQQVQLPLLPFTC